MNDTHSAVISDPFERSIWESGQAFEPDSDVPSLHREGTEFLVEHATRVMGDGRSRVALVLGQPGLGKSHLLARVQHLLTGGTFPVVIRDYARPQAVFRTLLRRLIWALLHQQGPRGRSFLDILSSELFRALLRAREGLQAELGEVPEEATAAWRKEHFLPRCLAELPSWCRELMGGDQPPVYSSELFRALLLYRLEEYRLPLERWLLGRDMEREDLEGVGLRHGLDDEESAKEALASLGLAARATRPFLVCMDQTEQLESAPEESGIDAMARVITYLRELPGFAVVFTCLKVKWNADYGPNLPSSYRDRFDEGGNARVELLRPSVSEALELVRRRLEGSLEPFTEENLAAFVEAHQPSPRILLQECSRHYRAWQREGRVGEAELPVEDALALEAPAAPGTEPRGGADAELADRWQATQEREPVEDFLDAERVAAFLGLLVEEFPLLVEGKRVQQLPIRKGSQLSLRLRIAGEHVGVVVSDTENGTSFTNGLKRILKELDGPDLDRLVFLRDRPLGGGWKKGRDLYSSMIARLDVLAWAPPAPVLHRWMALRTLVAGLAADGREVGVVASDLVAREIFAAPEVVELREALGWSMEGRASEGPVAAPPAAAVGAAPATVQWAQQVLEVLERVRIASAERLGELVAEAAGEALPSERLGRVVEDLVAEGRAFKLTSKAAEYVVAQR